MMSRPKSIPRAPLFFHVILFITFKLSSCMNENHISHNNIQCPETEKQALLSFKQSLEDPFDLLSSWNNRTEVNCCNWDRVVCNNFTGHVQQLHLRNSYDHFSIGSSAFLSGKITQSLLNLTQLRYLDLSYNNFTGVIPSFIGSLRSLRYLNLPNAGFHGSIPHSIGNLSNLRVLALGREDTNNFYANSLEWLSGLSKLKHLNMNRVNLSKAAANWALVINSLPSLVQVHLNHCNLRFSTDSPMNEVNVSSSLAVLDLSSHPYLYYFPSNLYIGDSIFPSPVPRWIFQLSNLVFLDLNGNSLEGPIPSISNTTKLQHIALSYNNFINSTIPDWLYSCTDLQFVHLSFNSLQGTISSAIANLSSLNTLDLSYNELSGKIPRDIANLFKMQMLNLAGNKLQGELSDSFGHLTDQIQLMSLEELYLNDNKLSGNLPQSIGQMFHLKSLFIGNNKLEGVVTESHFVNLTKLKHLDAPHNHRLSLKVHPNWNPPFKLEILRLASWDLGTTNIPLWLDTQKNLDVLDLSSTGISDLVPSWIWGINHLNLSDNQLHGKIPDKFGNNTCAFLSSNQFSGSLPRIGDQMKGLDLSNNQLSVGLSHLLCDKVVTNRLVILFLSGNQLTGELPDCFMNWPLLKVLDLGNNNLSGSIPNSIGFLTKLWSLDLQSNRFSGQIPFSMHKCLGLGNINLAHNNIEGNVPKWMGMSLPDLKFLILRSNKLSGQIPSDICFLNSLQILDLSYNNFSGMVPRCVDNFTAMANKKSESLFTGYYTFNNIKVLAFLESATATTKGRESQYSTILGLVTNMDLSSNNLSGDIPKGLTSLVELGSLNLSGNQLTGLIPHNIGDLKQLESLDLSRNSLSGGIPDSFSTMTSLNYLNLSYNKLTGKIPESTQFNTFNASSFIGNQLCGPPLTRNCSRVPAPWNEEGNEGGKPKIDWFYVFVSSGFAVGFSAACSTLMLNKSWRDAYFGFVEDIWDKLYVFCYVKWRMFVRQ